VGLGCDAATCFVCAWMLSTSLDSLVCVGMGSGAAMFQPGVPRACMTLVSVNLVSRDGSHSDADEGESGYRKGCRAVPCGVSRRSVTAWHRLQGSVADTEKECFLRSLHPFPYA
jgi:hypothetical protein